MSTVLTPPPAARVPATRSRQLLVGLAVVVLAVLWFVKLPNRALAHPDEGRYAEIPREMVATGDWVTPRLNGFTYLQKPPLQYWATAAAYEAFGAAEWTARLWTALTGLAAVGLAWLAGRRLLGRDAGDFGALALLASPYFVVMSGINTLDVGVGLFLNGAVLAYLLSRQAATHRAAAWMLAAWAAMALAVLSKGLIGVVLPLATLVGYALWHRDRSAFARLYWVRGIALFLAITVPWFVLAARANPEFLQYFFVHEHFQRFTSTAHNRAGPVWYFVPILALAIGPWAVAAAAGLRQAWRARPAAAGTVSPRRFLLVWCAVVFVFFSVSQSKLPAYLVPIVPALALLAGDALANGGFRRPAFAVAVGVMVFGILLFTVNEFAEPRYLHLLDGTGEVFADWTEAGAMLLVTAAGIGLYWVDRTDPRRVVVGVLGACYVATSFAMIGYGALAPLRSGAAFAREINRAGAPATPVYAVRMYEQTLPFYLDRLVTVVDFRGELEPGAHAAPDNRMLSLPEFRARWLADAQAFAVMPPDTFAALRADGFPMAIVAEDPKKVLVTKPPG